MTDLPKLTKREWDALGNLLLPLELGGKMSLGPKLGPKLKDLGLVEEAERVIPPGRGEPFWLRTVIKGWRMTENGHRIYCAWAATQPLDPRDEEPDVAP